MRQWKYWIWPGVAAVACITVLAIWLRLDVVEADIGGRAVAELGAEHDWAQISMDGRDLTLRGLAPSEDRQAAAVAAAYSVYGVRIVRDETGLLPLEDPYVLSAEKTENGVTLNGFAPDGATRKQIVSELSKTLPGIALLDQLRLARGAPEKLPELAAFALKTFSWLSTGSIEISGQSVSIRGEALNPEDHEAVLAYLTASLPDGAVLYHVDIAPAAAVGGYDWSVELDEGTLTLSGYVPDAKIRADLLAAAKLARPDLIVVDQMRFASGVTEGVDWTAATAQALDLVSRLKKGRGQITGDRLDLSGLAGDAEEFRRIQKSLQSRLAGGLVLGSTDLGLASVSPFEWSAQVSQSGLELGGYVPSEALRLQVLEIARLKFGSGEITDHQKVAPGAGDGFEAAVLAALQAVSRLEDAKVSLLDAKLTLSGTALSATAMEEVRQRLSQDLPQGFEVTADVAVKPLPGDPLGGSACQDGLNLLMKSNTVLFETGQAAIQSHSYGFLDRIAFVARQCKGVRLEISGHTDSDGAEDANMVLSLERARSVLTYMVAAGVPADQIEALGLGESRPVADNATDAGKAANRRIEFRVVD